MRSGAGTSNKILTTLKKGSRVEVVSESNGWLKIKYNGSTGYVSAEFVDKPGSSNTSESNSDPVMYTGTTTANLNVRSGAGTSHKILTTLKKGSRIEVVSEAGRLAEDQIQRRHRVTCPQSLWTSPAQATQTNQTTNQ
ncbi:N-acetylmuramoyl-L-alanine amidase [Sporolactobacillus inulinus]|uniref:N-acetylmuramoyl-L-alanine amidase n=1 Tax=Sporolactobacillus inulinus TaxID=2078 RepID=A0A4Y1ZDM7_9BACL|nr:SH3 domain-containing protein [Sporolactobacillus inulinus]GAY77139.1 N-acetylmuramoyl-L-alanine amidase [Sporolactobacillus inulinus]